MAATLALAAALTGCRHARLDQLPATIETTRAELRIPALSVAIVRDGEIVLARGFGNADAETLYPIGSITKTFTAFRSTKSYSSR